MLSESRIDVMNGVSNVNDWDSQEQDKGDQTFGELYSRWREECEAMDWVEEEQSRLERQLSAEPGPEPDIPPGSLQSASEGRRLLKFSSEYEMELVLKQSEETARIEQEKLDREAKKVQADMEKEARLPDQDQEDDIARAVLIDTNRHRDPDFLTSTFSYHRHQGQESE